MVGATTNCRSKKLASKQFSTVVVCTPHNHEVNSSNISVFFFFCLFSVLVQRMKMLQIKIRRNCRIAGTVVEKTLPKYEIVGSNPASYILRLPKPVMRMGIFFSIYLLSQMQCLRLLIYCAVRTPGRFENSR